MRIDRVAGYSILDDFSEIMKKIPGIQKLKIFSKRLSLADFKIIEKINLESINGKYSIECRLATDCSDSPIILEAYFYEVSKLRIDTICGYGSTIDGFSIAYVGENGLENINWEVIDYEDDQIQWYCKDMEILNVKSKEK